MTIGIITFHFALNQGAVLQCFALQKYLEMCGHTVQIIDYCPIYHKNMYAPVKNPFIYADMCRKYFSSRSNLYQWYRMVRSFIRCIIDNLEMKDKKMSDCFSSFISDNLHITTQTYCNLNELKDNPPNMQVYITGSDQVWNPNALGGKFDPAYFLDFGGVTIKRIAYAVSLGENHDINVLCGLKDLCRRIDAISFRENYESIKKIIDRDVHICIDPTLLLLDSDYSDIESPICENDPYIFVYGFETNNKIDDALDLAVKKYTCRVINGSPRNIKLKRKVENIFEYGPGQFLTLIKNAECIVTNSFHGTVFSIIYKKDFISIAHSVRGIRMIDLIKTIGLSERLWEDSLFSFSHKIDYNEVDKNIDMLRNESKIFLDNSLNS